MKGKKNRASQKRGKQAVGKQAVGKQRGEAACGNLRHIARMASTTTILKSSAISDMKEVI